MPTTPSFSKNFFRIILVVFAILVILLHAKTLRLPLALAVATTSYETSQATIGTGDLLVLWKQETATTCFTCYDTLATACTIRPGGEGYQVRMVLGPWATMLLVGAGLGLVVLAGRHSPVVALFMLLFLVNGFFVGLAYVDQGAVRATIAPLERIERQEQETPLQVVYRLSLPTNVTVEDVSCTTVEGDPLLVQWGAGEIRVEIPVGLALEKLYQAAGGAPVGTTPISAAIPYKCRVELSYGVLELKDSVEVRAEPLRFDRADGAIRIYNPNIIPFNVTLTVLSDTDTVSSIVVVEPLSNTTFTVPDGARRVYASYDYFGSRIQVLVWG